MNVPPPFSPPQAAPPKKSNTTLIIVIVLVCIMVPCIGVLALGAFGFNFFKNNLAPMASCVIGYEMVRDSVNDYAKEHQDTLPKAETWQDDVRPYYKKRLTKDAQDMGPIAPMPADGSWGCKVAEDRFTGMAFNSDVSGKKLKDIENPDSTVLIFEIEQAMLNAHQPYKKLPKENAPKIFGETRGWIHIAVEGDVQGFEGKRRGTVRIKTD